jgi:hypothetical protein
MKMEQWDKEEIMYLLYGLWYSNCDFDKLHKFLEDYEAYLEPKE